MRLRDYELQPRLQQQLPQIIYISGDEALLLEEATELYIKESVAKGFTERESFSVNANFNFNLLFDAAGNMSLFAEKKLIILKLETIKLGKSGALFAKWLASLNPEICVLIQSAKLDAAAQKTAWFKKLDELGWVIQVWPVGLDKLPGWILQRAKALNLSLDSAGAEVLAFSAEGNLLAAKQELDKLSLIYSTEKITAEMLLNTVSDLSHYDVFQLADSALQNKPQRTIKIFRNLIGEGLALQVIIWALARDLRELISMKLSGLSLAAYKHIEYIHPMIWKRRMPLFANALNKNSLQSLKALLKDLNLIDKTSKGLVKADAELQMERFFIAMYNGQS